MAEPPHCPCPPPSPALPQVCVLSIITSIVFFALPLAGRCHECDTEDPAHCVRGESAASSRLGGSVWQTTLTAAPQDLPWIPAACALYRHCTGLASCTSCIINGMPIHWYEMQGTPCSAPSKGTVVEQAPTMTWRCWCSTHRCVCVCGEGGCCAGGFLEAAGRRDAEQEAGWAPGTALHTMCIVHAAPCYPHNVPT